MCVWCFGVLVLVRVWLRLKNYFYWLESEECWELDWSIHREICASLGMNRMQRRTTYFSYRESIGSYKYGEVVVGKEI